MKARATARLYEAIQGFACHCEPCVKGSVLFQPVAYCARCGHGYLHIGNGATAATSSCNKCGAVGRWTETKPDLPAPPIRRYEVRLQRSIEQTTVVVVEGLSPYDAVTNALEGAKDAETAWTSLPPATGPHSVGDVVETSCGS